MKKLVSLLFIAFFAALSAHAQALVLTHVNIIDGVSAKPLRDATLFIRDGKIEDIVPGPAHILAGATVLDMKGKWVLPGFVDAHVHIADFASARRALQSGATTVRSMGVSNFADVGFRELNHGGIADVPDVVAAGYHVRPRLAEEIFLNFPELRDLMGGLSGAENIRRVIRAMASHHVDVIKILATERAGLPDTDPRKRTFTDEELAAIVDEARKAGLPVAAHAHGEEGAAAAVRAGVRSIEHGTYLSDATLAMMKEKGVCLDPTIATVEDLIEPGGDYDNALLSIRGRHMLPRVREMAAHAWKAGVTIIAGTDTGYGPNSNRRIPHEVAELVGIGMSPMDAIKAATSASATCMGIEKRTGSIKVGLEADLIAVERNPLDNIVNLQDVLLVVNNGKIVVNRLVW
ncbi:MAG: amidohydrolase family protein [Acidobacteria bacterium]|nr:amidohydrolase family protein [Acidobacteriota bacterium]